MKVAEVEAGREQTGQRSSVAYDLFAPAYQQFFAPEAAKASLEIFDQLLLCQVPRCAHVLDLCSGGGELTSALVDRGFRVTAIDNSQAMLRLARSRGPQAKFVQADLRHIPVKRSFDAVICAYNSLPQVTCASDLEAVCRAVRGCLREDGRFLFDLYGESAYQDRWRGTFVKVDDQLACIVRATYDPQSRLGENRITLFRMRGDPSHAATAQCGAPAWQRSDLTLTTRAYGDQELRSILTTAGFRDIARYDGERDLNVPHAAGRIFWLCA